MVCGHYGTVSQFAQEHHLSRQYVYREAQQVTAILEGTSARQEIEGLQAEVATLRQQVVELQRRLDVAVVIDEEKQAELACVGQGCGVTLPQCHTLVDVRLFLTRPFWRLTVSPAVVQVLI